MKKLFFANSNLNKSQEQQQLEQKLLHSRDGSLSGSNQNNNNLENKENEFNRDHSSINDQRNKDDVSEVDNEKFYSFSQESSLSMENLPQIRPSKITVLSKQNVQPVLERLQLHNNYYKYQVMESEYCEKSFLIQTSNDQSPLVMDEEGKEEELHKQQQQQQPQFYLSGGGGQELEQIVIDLQKRQGRDEEDNTFYFSNSQIGQQQQQPLLTEANQKQQQQEEFRVSRGVSKFKYYQQDQNKGIMSMNRLFSYKQNLYNLINIQTDDSKKYTYNLTAIIYQELQSKKSWKSNFSNFIINLMIRTWYYFFMVREIFFEDPDDVNYNEDKKKFYIFLVVYTLFLPRLFYIMSMSYLMFQREKSSNSILQLYYIYNEIFDQLVDQDSSDVYIMQPEQNFPIFKKRKGIALLGKKMAFILTPSEFSFLQLPKLDMRKTMSIFYMSNFIFQGIETVLGLPVLTIFTVCELLDQKNKIFDKTLNCFESFDFYLFSVTLFLIILQIILVITMCVRNIREGKHMLMDIRKKTNLRKLL